MAAPQMTKSLHIALEDLKLRRAWVVYPSHESYPVHERVEAMSLEGMLNLLAKSFAR